MNARRREPDRRARPDWDGIERRRGSRLWFLRSGISISEIVTIVTMGAAIILSFRDLQSTTRENTAAIVYLTCKVEQADAAKEGRPVPSCLPQRFSQ